MPNVVKGWRALGAIRGKGKEVFYADPHKTP